MEIEMIIDPRSGHNRPAIRCETCHHPIHPDEHAWAIWSVTGTSMTDVASRPIAAHAGQCDEAARNSISHTPGGFTHWSDLGFFLSQLIAGRSVQPDARFIKEEQP